jgi:hypothetical protein
VYEPIRVFTPTAFSRFLEERALPYIVVARLTSYLKSRLYQITQWRALDSIYSVSEFRFQLWQWKEPRRFVVVREMVQTKKPAVGRKLIDLSDYVFRVFVTNRADAALEISRNYNGRAAVECRIDELGKRVGGRSLLSAVVFRSKTSVG